MKAFAALFAIAAVFTVPAAVALAQDDAVNDAESDAYLFDILDAAPTLAMDAVEIKLTPALSLHQIPGIAVDSAGNFYVFQRGEDADPIVVVSPDGRVLRSFGRGLFEFPHNIRIDPAGNVWAIDSRTSMVVKFSPAGEKLLEISVGDIPDPESQFCGTADVAVSAQGEVFIADGYCNSRVVVYNAQGQRIREWGRPGTGPGEFNLVHSLAIGPDGNIYVVDRENGRLQWFTPAGEYISEWRSGGRLLGIAFIDAGELYLSVEPKGARPMVQGRVLKLDPATGRILGKLALFGHEIAATPDGTLLPATMNDSIMVYRP